MMRGKELPTALVFCCMLAGGMARAETVQNDSGLECQVDAEHGDYQITDEKLNWTIAGSLSKPLDGLKESDGRDGIGAFREIRFKWAEDGKRAGSIRVYRDKPVVVFSETFVDGMDHAPSAFPVLTKLPQDLFAFRYGEDEHLHPATFTLQSDKTGEQYSGPVSLFDEHANAMVISPASHFMAAMTSGNLEQGIASGLNRTLKSVPAGYTQETILAVDHGINRTWSEWGHALTDLYGKKRPTNDADLSLKYLSYWTDNGAAYYYNYDPSLGYANTLLAVKKHLDEVGVSIHSFQLDSWWYPKTFNSVQKSASNKPRAKDPRLPAGEWNRYGGLLTYTASPDLFPQGMKAFDKALGLPLITHNRWIDPTSPYWKDYKISGIGAVDLKWWDKIIGDIHSWGVVTYEQDWNDYIYNLSPEFSQTTWAGDAFLDNMARACKEHNMTMQYCMVLPRDLMQGGAKYGNLTSVRLSGDRFDRGRWREFLLGSEMAGTLSVWPWTDVFKSDETGNILLADLSAGIVGLSDAIGKEDLANISRVARKDGMIVKPDEPLVPMDQTFIAMAKGKKSPMVCATHSGDCTYVFSFSDKKGHGEQTAEFKAKSLGLSGKVFVYDYFAQQGKLAEADEKFSQKLNEDGWAYDIVCPVGKSGMGLIGDLGLFATSGRQRIAKAEQRDEGLKIKIALAGERQVVLGLYAPAEPKVTVTGPGKSRCTVQYDAATGLCKANFELDNTDRKERQWDVTFALPSR